MKYPNFILEQDYTKTTKQALQEDYEESDCAEPPHPGPGLAQPKPNRKDDGQQADERSKDAMRVLVKNVALPEMQRKQKHVVAVGGRPIWHGHAGFVAGYKAAK